MDMFCYQCEQAYRSTGCNEKGVCGKSPESSSLMDLIVYQLKGISYLAHQARLLGKTDEAVNRFTLEALFVTVTNVNFDNDRLIEVLRQGAGIRDKIQKIFEEASPGKNNRYPGAVKFSPEETLDSLLSQSVAYKILGDHPNADIRSLEHLLVYGIKGMAAYADHALLLGYQDDTLFAFIHKVFSRLNDQDVTVEELVGLNMECGRVNMQCMELLDRAHTETYGHPEPTTVSKGVKKGPAIIVSGHDLKDLEELLKQTEGKGIHIYTHGEMLPAHGYPGLKKYKHLVGHYGTAWQNQQKEFQKAPAAFYFTTNCLMEPKSGYADRVFTGGMVGWPGMKHIQNRDFTPVIEKALEAGGFPEDKPGKTVMTGFGHNAVLSIAGKVVEAVKSGAIRHFFLVGGCDGARPGRNYYTNLTQQVPKDCVILTLACGKFRFHEYQFGDIGGIPRLLDVGQCNDAYSAVKIAEALAGAFQCGVNDLPLTLIISWYEQKAVAVLLSLLALGIKGIRLGPTLPAFITPNILDFLVKQFDIKLISTPEKDLQAVLEPASI